MVTVNKENIFSAYYFYESKYIINNLMLMSGAYYLIAIIIECEPG